MLIDNSTPNGARNFVSREMTKISSMGLDIDIRIATQVSEMYHLSEKNSYYAVKTFTF